MIGPSGLLEALQEQAIHQVESHPSDIPALSVVIICGKAANDIRLAYHTRVVHTHAGQGFGLPWLSLL